MKKGQLIALGLAALCGLGAIVGMQKLTKPKVETRVEVQSSTTKVLVARQDIGLGTVTTDASFRWQEYPEGAVPQSALTCKSANCSMRDHAGTIARAPIMKDELITRSKLVKAGEGGVLASILPQGTRAMSVQIRDEHLAAGKLILPNDYVDVILIRRLRSKGGADEHISDTVFRNVRVLAVGQRIEVKDGQKNVDGNTATLELTPEQAEQLALAKSMGEISLALRSIADFKEDKGVSKNLNANKERGNSVKMLRYGVRSRAHGVN